MVEQLLTLSNVEAVLGILGIIFGIYLYFRNPQVQNEMSVALLAQQLKYMTDSTDSRFSEMGKRIDEAMKIAQNHIHTIDTKVDTLTKIVGDMSVEVGQLSTIIDERIPKKS